MTADLQRFKSELTAHLDWFAERGRKVRFWWRDDDAIEPTPLLDRLLAHANQHNVDVALAVIPKNATEALAERLATERHAWVLQHGWQHKNFQRKDLREKAAELGTRRDPDELMAQLVEGKARLESLFGTKFIHAMVPPWNRIAPEISRRLPGIGIPGLSSFTWHNFPRTHQVQSHIDILKWKKQVRFIGWESARLRFDLQLTRRRNGTHEPVGILTHHLAHDEGCFEFLDEFLAIAAHHDGAEWPEVKGLFGTQ
ncbi:MAG: polysaccharide deacetylase family protein [Roseibium sp.]|uniref:polysaccharide deacetylase family protein n=1 Tax=Roseibium sp. TaxID=1936156 RepID=UPI001B01B91E|nr:polysaccharide deacetylase family protein [Roseibium sp.]MBO6511140.1 polysaccharide deacetylase family protein [Roseibium sp.]MBO6892323.1 polysaccharide deacetylase family protein [Roseibium sp.]MBO6929026.1 polysaccharide deacetylase family protein [Roseibium sp.]